jgi:hypothetical protein
MRIRHRGNRVKAEDITPGAWTDPWPSDHPTHRELVELWMTTAHALGYLVAVTHDSREQHWGADSGWPDIFAVRDGRAYAIEVKTPAYDTVTDEQRAWLDRLGKVPGITEGVFRTSGDKARDMAVIAEILRLQPPIVPRGMQAHL